MSLVNLFVDYSRLDHFSNSTFFNHLGKIAFNNNLVKDVNNEIVSYVIPYL